MEKRIIKFRAWDANRKVFKYPKLWDNTMPSNWDAHYVLQQFTGLLDRNGNEIYEGDLLHRHMNVYWKVVFKDSKWIADEITPTCSLYLDASQFVQAEVIGNLYEHKHLITN